MLPYLERVFADIIKDLERRALSWITWVDPKSNDSYPYKGEAEGDLTGRRKGGGNEATEAATGVMLP